MAVSTEPTEQGHPIEHPSGMNLAERIESVKAGGVGAIATLVTVASLLLMNRWLAGKHIFLLTGIQGRHLSASLLAAILSGFLFGITYRYVIRHDRNSHLGDGAVLAFGLVRGLAQVDAAFPLQSLWLPLILTGIESIGLFAIARVALDFSIHRGWVKAFRSADLAYFRIPQIKE